MDFITLIFVEKIKFINVKHNIQVLLIETSKLPYNLCMNSMMLEKVKNSDRVGTYMRLLPIFYLLCFLEYPVSVNCKSTKTMRASDIASYQYSHLCKSRAVVPLQNYLLLCLIIVIKLLLVRGIWFYTV
jgi:hypothetical protein